IDATDLVDLPVREDVIDLLPNIRITALDRIWSDHNPILLHVDKIDFSPSPFKLYNFWLLRDGFDDLNKSEWDLLDSNKTENRKAVAFEEITSIEKKIDEGSALPSNTENRLNLLHELEKINKLASMDLIQKAQTGVRNLAYFRDMLNEIGQVNIEVSEDTCVWSVGPKGTFTVKDARNIIDQKTFPSLAHSITWDKTIPRKVNIFMWRLSLDRLPHRLNLSLCGIDIPVISCSSCNANVESANHIFFE
ncbi:RNA-directed DNA polymerase, eukaryota, partial [Tanacetum coccineum]